MWVNEYLLEVHGETRGLEIIADIDHRYVLFLALFSELTCSSVYQRFLRILGYDDSQMVATLLNGLATIRKL